MKAEEKERQRKEKEEEEKYRDILTKTYMEREPRWKEILDQEWKENEETEKREFEEKYQAWVKTIEAMEKREKEQDAEYDAHMKKMAECKKNGTKYNDPNWNPDHWLHKDILPEQRRESKSDDGFETEWIKREIGLRMAYNDIESFLYYDEM